jgi:hypothetical protein
MTKTRDLADLGGGFIQAGTGAVQRTVESKLQDVVSVKDFGAVGDGVADDYSAIAAARDYCLSTSPYKQLFFPPGTYKITQKLTFATPGLSVLGAGKRSSTIHFTGSGIAIEFTDANPNNGAFAFGSEIQDISIKGNAGATTLLRVKNVNHFYARNVNLYEASITTGCGLRIGASTVSIVELLRNDWTGGITAGVAWLAFQQVERRLPPGVQEPEG